MTRCRTEADGLLSEHAEISRAAGFFLSLVNSVYDRNVGGELVCPTYPCNTANNATDDAGDGDGDGAEDSSGSSSSSSSSVACECACPAIEEELRGLMADASTDTAPGARAHGEFSRVMYFWQKLLHIGTILDGAHQGASSLINLTTVGEARGLGLTASDG